MFNVDSNDELNDEEYFEAIKQTRVFKAINIFTKILNKDVIHFILAFGGLLILLGVAIDIVQSLLNNAWQFAKQAYEEYVTTENLRTIVHATKESSNTLKEALNNAREFWNNA